MLSTHPPRLARALRALADQQLDALVLTPGPDLQYLTGFTHGHAGERLLALVLRADGGSRWVVPAMNVAQVRPHAAEDHPVISWSDADTYFPALADALAGAKSIAFDEEARAGFLLDLISIAPAARLHKSSSIIRPLRIRKDASELAALRIAAAAADKTIGEAISFCRPDRTENQIDQDLRAALLANGPGQSIAFTIIASGPNGAHPHHETASRAVQEGDIVILDFGTREPGGYPSDITVTCSVGEPAAPDARRIYKIVYDAQQAALAAVRPGVTAEAVDRAARSVIEKAGLGAHFLHRTGHGLGLAIHEHPYIVAGNTQPLEEGMVFSIEPGIYLPGRFGVRLEVITAVGRDGAVLLNAPSAAELPIVGQ